MKRRLIIVAFLALSFSSFAEMRWTKSESNSPENLHEAKIVYIGEVNSRLVSEIISAINDINNNYPAVKVIELYISSFGGSMESGYLAYAEC